MKKILFSVIASIFAMSVAFSDTVPTTQPTSHAVIQPVIQPAAVPQTSTTPTQSVTTQPSTPAQTQTPQFTTDQINQLHQIIRDYLISNPDVLLQASKVLQAQQEQKMETHAITAIQKNKVALFDDVHSPTLGNKTAPITLVEFYDYQCGHCKQMAPIVEKVIGTDKNLHVIFKELPIFGEVSKYAAEAALASVQQHKFYKFHHLLLAADGLTKNKVIQIAEKAGLNIETLKQEMKSPMVAKQIRDNFQLAQSLQLMGTPTFVITNHAQTTFRYIPGATSLEDLQKQIQSVG